MGFLYLGRNEEKQYLCTQSKLFECPPPLAFRLVKGLMKCGGCKLGGGALQRVKLVKEY